MARVDRFIAHLVRVRGPAAVWEIATAATLAPYLLSAVLPAPAFAMSAALAFSLILLVVLRDSVTVIALAPHAHPGGEPSSTRQDKTLTGGDHVPASELLIRQAIESAVEAHDISEGPALLGLIRFVNHRAMVAYNSAGAHEVMREFGSRLKTAIGARHTVAQIEDDTFAIFLTSSEDPEAELGSIAYVLAQDISAGEMTVLPDIHVGHGRLDASTSTFAAAMSVARASLGPLRRPRQSKPPIPRATPERLAERFAIEQALRRSVREGQLSLRYQPFFDANAGRITGAEALLRWRHPQWGDVSPARFIPLLEETGLIHEIGLWTLNSACRQLRQWHESGRKELRLAINLSAIQLQSRSLRTLLERTLASHELAPSAIELELTETAAMEDQQRTAALFRELRAQGFGIALDDFGSGHSNLSYLKNLPFTKLKIDREFVSHVDSRPGSQAICKALVELGAGLGISILAEGVERREEVLMLRGLGCHVFQGFYFARPLTADDLSQKLADDAWLTGLGMNASAGRSPQRRGAA